MFYRFILGSVSFYILGYVFCSRSMCGFRHIYLFIGVLGRYYFSGVCTVSVVGKGRNLPIYPSISRPYIVLY